DAGRLSGGRVRLRSRQSGNDVVSLSPAAAHGLRVHVPPRLCLNHCKRAERSVSTQARPVWSARSGLYFVLLFGAVNLFADMTYEGARSVTGPFLGMLGASGFIVGAVTGFGEFLGYALRLV